MAVVGGGEIMGGGARTCTVTAAGSISFTRKFRIFTDDKHTEPYEVFVWLQDPKQNLYLGLPYETSSPASFCPWSYLASIEIAEETEDGVQYLATAHYEPYNPGIIGTLNPLLAFTQASLQFEETEIPVYGTYKYDDQGQRVMDSAGNPVIKWLVNSAGQFFPTGINSKLAQPVLRITRNEQVVNTTLLSQMMETTNLYGAGSAGLDPLSWLNNWPPKTLRFANAEVSWQYHNFLGVYYTVSYIFKVQWRTWLSYVLDQGTRSRDPDSGYITNNYYANGGNQVVTDPQKLDGSGSLLPPTDQNGNPSQPVFLEFEPYVPVSYDIFQFKFPISTTNFPPWYRPPA